MGGGAITSVLDEMSATDISDDKRRKRVPNLLQFVNDKGKSRRLCSGPSREIYDGLVAYNGSWDDKTRCS
jgi:hypothetical protein